MAVDKELDISGNQRGISVVLKDPSTTPRVVPEKLNVEP
jgi:hypothetical protein